MLYSVITFALKRRHVNDTRRNFVQFCDTFQTETWLLVFFVNDYPASKRLLAEIEIVVSKV